MGVIGAGNIGGIVCERARNLKMKVLAYDPFLSSEKALEMGVDKIEEEKLVKELKKAGLNKDEIKQFLEGRAKE